MKNSLLFSAVLLTVFFTAKAQEHFYYYHGEKFYLDQDSQRISVISSSATLPRVHALTETTKVIEDLSRNHLNSTAEARTAEQSPKLYYYEINTTKIRDVKSRSKVVQRIQSNPSTYNSFLTYKTKNGKLLGVSNNFYVKLKKESDVQILKGLVDQKGLALLGQDKYMPLWYVVGLPAQSAQNALELANSFFETGMFQAAEPALIYHELRSTNDPYFPYQWSLKNTGQYGSHTVGLDIDAENAWTLSKGKGIKTAVYDQGFELDHPDLIGNALGEGFDANEGAEPAQVRGPHGTACAGIVGAVQNNNLGVSGVAPETQLISISIDLEWGDAGLQIASGFNWAWQNGVDVISNSWGGYAPARIIVDAIDNALTRGRNGKGTVVVFSSGNENENEVQFPANSLPEILVVGAMSPCGERKSLSSCDAEYSWGSCYGPPLDVVAPGVFIPTTDRSGPAGYHDSDYILNFDGTSSACPAVAGIAALLLALNPDLTRQQVVDLIERSARKLDNYNYEATAERPNGLWNIETGYGLVNAYEALKLAQHTTAIRDNVAADSLELNSLEALSPNPAYQEVRIGYRVRGTAILVVTPLYPSTGASHQYALDATATQIHLNLSDYSPGLHQVSLRVNGQLIESKNLLIQ